MSEILKFKLKKDIRNPVSEETNSGYFVGRINEIKKLLSILVNRNSATVIIGGVRGVGKTSFVQKTLSLADKEDGIKKLLKSNISLADFEIGENESHREKILKLLIRSLYFSIYEHIEEGNVKNTLLELYTKTYYKDIHEHSLHELVNDTTHTNREISTNETVLKLSSNNNLVKISKYILSTVIATAGLNNLINQEVLNWWVIIFTLALIFFIFKFDISFSNKKEIEEGKSSQQLQKTGFSGVGQFDISADTMEIKLTEVITSLSSKYKIVFVIDELDKLSDGSETNDLSQHPVFNVIKPLKNLFSLSNAIYIFIGADNFFDRLEEDRVKKPYSSSYTLFSDRIFLNSLYYEDIENLIDAYREDIITVGDEFIYKQFKAYISWEAKNHIFDTHNLISKYTTIDENGDHFLVLTEDDELNRGNLEEDWKIASGLQVFVSATYENQRYRGNDRLNEKLYLALREIAQKVYEAGNISILDKKYFQSIKDEDLKRLKIDNLTEKDKENFDGAIEDLLTRMERQGFLVLSITDNSDEGLEEVTEIETYSLAETEFPDKNKIKNRNMKLGFESDFISELNKLTKVIKNLRSAGYKSYTKYSKEHIRYQVIKRNIEKESKNREQKSKILEHTYRIQNILEEIDVPIFNELVQRVVDQNGATLINVSRNISGQPMWAIDRNISDFYTYLHNQNKDLVYKLLQLNGNYMVIGHNFDEEVQNEYLSEDHSDRKSALTTITNICSDTTSKNKSRQMKWSKIQVSLLYSNLKAVENKLNKRIEKSMG